MDKEIILIKAVFILFVALGVAGAATAQGYKANPPLQTLTPKKLDNPLLAELLGLGEVQDLGDENLSLRLYAVAGANQSCVPETDAFACSVRYYLSVASFELPPEAVVYYLGEFGEIAGLKRLEAPEFGRERIRFEARRYSKDVLEANPELAPAQQTAIYEATIGLDGIQLRRVVR